MSVSKYIFRTVILIPVVYTLAVGAAFIVPYFKITDPDDPRFEPHEFQLIDTYWMHSDYEKYRSSSKKKKLSMKKLFPDGMDIDDVDSEMLNGRRCDKILSKHFRKNPTSGMKEKIDYYCPYEWWGLFFYDWSFFDYPRLKVRIYLDENDKVLHPAD